MKKDGQFTQGIQLKFILLRLFNAFLIILFGVFCIHTVRSMADTSASLVENRLPKLHVTQEVYAAVLSLSLSSSEILNDVSQGEEAEPESLQELDEGFKKAYLYLDALIYGTASDEFRMRHGTEWEAFVQNEHQGVKTPSQTLSSDAQISFVHVKAFEDALKGVLTSNPILPDNATSSEVQVPAREFEARLTADYILPITASLDVIHDLLEAQMDSGITEINETNQRQQLIISLLALLSILVTFLAGLMFSDHLIVSPLRELTRTAEAMADGKLSLRVKIDSRDEIGKLAYTFNKLASRLQASYDDLEQIVKEKTDALSSVLQKLETKNDDLEKSQMATINLLEDLEEEKRAVEQRVKDRTEELERERNKLLQVTSNMKGGGILLDEHGSVVFSNEATFSMLGLPSGGSAEHVLESFLLHFEGDAIRQYFKECVGGKTFHVQELNGHGRVYELFFHHLKTSQDDAEKSEGYFILFFDITDAKLLERSKSELVAVASHQLRTPLTAMRGNVEMLIDESFGTLNKEQHELLDDVEVSTIRLITMVNEMLDITKIEKGNLEMQIEDLNVKEVIDSVVDDLSNYAKRHEFEIDRSDLSSAVIIKGDKLRIRQIFQNLIDNAIKYSNHPGLLRIASKIEEGMVVLSFKDNGIGVPKNEQTKLFERFYRASNTAKASSSGSGLGLYIVKSIAQQLGGDISFESEEGVGTTFFVKLPLASK